MSPKITCYRYGSKRLKNEGLRLGVARQPPRGVRREDWQRRNYFDLWLRVVAPSADLVAAYKQGKGTITFATFTRRYQSQMKAPECHQVIALLATMAQTTPISLGCYCENEALCHRSLLKKLVLQEAAQNKTLSHARRNSAPSETIRLASPVCYAEEAD